MSTDTAADGSPGSRGDRSRQGGSNPATRLLPHIYAELRWLAALYLRNERSGHTLQPTALVNEALVRLGGRLSAAVHDRARLFTLAAASMRRVLIDHARRRRALKRGGGRPSGAGRAVTAAGPDRADVLAVHEAMSRLAVVHGRAARVAQLRFFGGLTLDEAATIMEVSRKTASEDWRFARAWLSRELSGEGSGP